MAENFDRFQVLPTGIVSHDKLRIYTGILGQIGDIICSTPTLRRLRQLFPNGTITCAVSERYQEAATLLADLPYVDHIFVARLYFERLQEQLSAPWHLGWPVDLRGEDEVQEQARHDIVLETRPRHRRMPWWEFAHQVHEIAHMLRVPGDVELQTEIAIPASTQEVEMAHGHVLLHNDASIDSRKGWPWSLVRRFAAMFGPERIALIGKEGPSVPGCLDLRGRLTLAESARALQRASCFVGIDSGPMWIAGSLQAPTVGLYGTEYIPAYTAIHPANPRAHYLQVEGSVAQIDPDLVCAAVEARLEATQADPTARGDQVAAHTTVSHWTGWPLN